MNKFLFSVVVGVAFIAALACSADPGPMLVQALAAAPQQPSNLPSWVSVTPVEECSAGCWRLASIEYLDEQASQGLHHAFVKAMQNEEQVGGIEWVVEYTTGRDVLTTKVAPDWGDAPLWSCFFPDQNEVGGYTVYIGEGTNSDRVHGLGLPYCWHVSYRLVYVWHEAGAPPTATLTATVTVLPSTPTPTATATITPTPCVGCPRHYLPVIRR